jgi:hypothetical protein
MGPYRAQNSNLDGMRIQPPPGQAMNIPFLPPLLLAKSFKSESRDLGGSVRLFRVSCHPLAAPVISTQLRKGK